MGFLRSAARTVLRPVLNRLDRRSDALIERRMAELDAATPVEPAHGPTDESPHRWNRHIWVPPVKSVQVDAGEPFMQHATCSAADFRHPDFERLCALFGQEPTFHRKQWEFAYVVHHLERLGMLSDGMTGIGFGVGLEPLPATFAAAGCTVVATDAPPEIAERDGWQASSQFSMSVDELYNDGLCDPELFRDRVSYRAADMNDIADDLTGFDFCWSACCFEHLGSIRHGLDFVVQSVEHCLRPGGVAVHTTEYNLSSNDETLEEPSLSIFRQSDIEQLIDELRSRGHQVSELIVAPDGHYLDQYVDTPPYLDAPHLKLELFGYVTTSVGLVIQKAG